MNHKLHQNASTPMQSSHSMQRLHNALSSYYHHSKEFTSKARTIIGLIIFFAAFIPAHAQVHVKLQQPPPNMLRMADLWKLTLNNPTTLTYIIKIEGVLDEGSEGRVVTGTSGSLTLPPGHKVITYDDVKQSGSVTFKPGKWQEVFIRTGNAPSGDYTICIYVKTKEGEELGSDCIHQNVEIVSGPELVSPYNGEVLSTAQALTVTSAALVPMFTWLPPTPAPKSLTYSLKIVEVLGSQPPEDAMLKNPAWFEKSDIPTTTIQYPLSAKKFENGRSYAWQVKAYSLATQVTISSSPIAASEVWGFMCKLKTFSVVKCGYAKSEFLGTVATDWRIQDYRRALWPSYGTDEIWGTDAALKWRRDIYKKYKVFKCTLALNHLENHQYDSRIVYAPDSEIKVESFFDVYTEVNLKDLKPPKDPSDSIPTEMVPLDLKGLSFIVNIGDIPPEKPEPPKPKPPCCHETRRFLRTVETNWHLHKPPETVSRPPSGRKTIVGDASTVIVWYKGIYNEWEIRHCGLEAGHGGNHANFNFAQVYTFEKSISKEILYGVGEAQNPPPDFGLPKVPNPPGNVVPQQNLPQGIH
ncbi:MAG: hypothetical protein U1C46_08420 [Bacteroidales bacterium]|nr:hypothetical protein [Bacteroidales bacterium]